jgi:hypothetical protein
LLPATAQTVGSDNELATQAIDTDTETDRVGLVDPTTGIWFLRGQNGVVGSFFYGNPGDVPFVGDWNCDGIDTPGLYRQSDGFVYLRNSNTQGPADIRFFFGNPGDLPLAGDFNDDGCDTVSIYRSSEQRIYIINKLGANDGGLGAADFSYIFGNPGDKPFVGDFNGDGVDTVGLHRESTGFVYFRQSHTQGNADNQFFFGDPGDRFVTGDWGVVDEIDTPGLFRPSNTTFFFRHSNTQGNADESLVMGVSTYLPIAGEWGTVTAGGPGNPGVPGPGPGPGPGTPPEIPALASQPHAAWVGLDYEAELDIVGGQDPYTFQIVSGPPWLGINASTGVLTGVPPSLGAFVAQIRVTDSIGTQALVGVTVNVVNQCTGFAGLLLTDCQALVALYQSTGGPGWTTRTGWFTSGMCSSVWEGIECTAGRVSEISLPGNNLVGSLPPTFTSMTGLRIIDLAGNDIGDVFPDFTGFSLQILDLSGGNDFSGDISTSPIWGMTTTLTEVLLGGNQLFGLPATIAMPNLVELDLSENLFDGPLPTFNTPSLDLLYLSANTFNGSLDQFWGLTGLSELNLSENEFTGGISAAVGGMTSLQDLDLDDISTLSGAIDDAFLNLQPPTGSLVALGLGGVGCMTTSGNAGLVAFLNALDETWDDGCL